MGVALKNKNKKKNLTDQKKCIYTYIYNLKGFNIPNIKSSYKLKIINNQM